MRGLISWFLGLLSPAANTGPRPTSPSSSVNSKPSSKPEPTTTGKTAGSKPSWRADLVELKDAGLSFKSPLKSIDPAKVDFVVIHHTANANPAWGVKECHKSHQNDRGWSGIGYNYFIEQDGTVYEGRADIDKDYIGAHVEGYNSRSVGICLAGHYDKQTPTAANLEVLAKVTAMLLRRYHLPTTAIRYHSELADKSCPGKNFPSRPEFAKLVAAV
jgi:N-acetylmuramoyl-L-alanine amidase